MITGSRVIVGLAALGVAAVAAGCAETQRASAEDGSAAAWSGFEIDELGEPVAWEAFDAPLLSGVRQLTSPEAGIVRAGEGYFSPDDRMMIYQAEVDPANPFFQIYTLDFATGTTRRLSTGVGKTTCAFFRAGTDEVLFASSHEDAEATAKQEAEIAFRASGQVRHGAWDYDPTMDVYTAKRDGSALTRVTSAYGYDAEAAFSPDGESIVFCSTRSGYDDTGAPLDAEGDPSYYGDLYLVKSDGTDLRRLTDAPGYDGGPFFVPGGERIVWRHFDESGRIAEVWTMRTDGSDKRQLTAMGAMSWAPYVHPSGAYVIFTTNVHGFRNFELYIVDAEGAHEPIRVTNADAFDGLPVFTPDGDHLSWTSSRTKNRKGQIFIARWDHEGALRALDQSAMRVAAND